MTTHQDNPTPPKPFQRFTERFPGIADAYSRLGESVRAAGPMTEREIHLVKLGISLGARLEGAAHAHTRKAIATGVDIESLHQVALLTCPTLGFPRMMAGMGWVEDVLEGEVKRDPE